ncbi:uncharacterized protein LOC125175379 isoform X6 [Prionailurus viverrinus]|uniref:uncharacterized protein LOC125175379 isoform X6 n=1 Tax=Prionailurus viverrinus TaxID=61388 RepID=UPI001FF3BB7A|nr:uncharacterized protein LOC125175379 isoform X6 [Prionailurus viverrinus]
MHQQGMSESSSGRNTSSQICASDSSYCSNLSESYTRSALSRNRRFHPHSDSGISSLLPSDSFKFLTWHKVEQHDIQGSQLRCPRIREGPSTEELLFRQEECVLPARKRVLEKNKWETWLQENWEDCTILQKEESTVQKRKNLLIKLIVVFSCLPNLKTLDGILKLPEDSSPPETNIFSQLCVIS